MMKFRIFCTLIAFALCALLTAAMQGQVGGATLTATVTDSSGAVIPGAQATLTDVDSGTHRTGTSNGVGTVSFIGLPAATYTLEVTASGYRKLRKTDIAVHIN